MTWHYAPALKQRWTYSKDKDLAICRKTGLTAIDLFCGAGGLTLAAQRSGVRVLAGVEFYRHACDTYEANFIRGKRRKTAPVLYRDDIKELQPAKIMHDLGLREGQLDILMGGPPCQGYSTHRINGTGVKDPRNELLLRYFSFVRCLKPKAFVVENVPGLLWPRHADYLRKFKAAAKRAGYRLHRPETLNARDYGVPQNRKRVFVVGFRKNIGSEFSWPEPSHLNPTTPKLSMNGHQPWVIADIVFKKTLQKDDPNAIHMNHSRELIDVFKRTPKNGGSRKDSGRELVCHRNHNGHKDVYGRIDPSKPGPTMTTACINPSKGRFVHPTKNHGITVRHAARLQGFPDDFIFKGGLIAGGIQVGNAVPIQLGEAVIASICQFITEESHQE